VQFNHPIGQEAQRPAGMAGGRFTTGQGDEAGLLRAIQLALVHAVGGAPVQRRFQTLLDVLAADAGDGRLAHLHGVGDTFVHPAGALRAAVGFEQDARVRQQAGWGRTGREQLE
jgi:hypothetical protein